jgi:hypothetical protein
MATDAPGGQIDKHAYDYTHRITDVVSRQTLPVTFTVDRPARDAWRFLRDSLRWREGFIQTPRRIVCESSS